MDLREIGWDVGDWIHLVQDSDQWWALVTPYNVVVGYQCFKGPCKALLKNTRRNSTLNTSPLNNINKPFITRKE